MIAVTHLCRLHGTRIHLMFNVFFGVVWVLANIVDAYSKRVAFVAKIIKTSTNVERSHSKQLIYKK